MKSKLIVRISVILFALTLFVGIGINMKDDGVKAKISKDEWYKLSNEVTFNLNINKIFNSDTDILKYTRKRVKEINRKPLELNKYYFVNIDGDIKDEYMSMYIELSTYKGNTFVEEAELGINSNFNVICLSKDYDNIKIDVVYSGKGTFDIDDIKIYEIFEFKQLDTSSVKFDNTYMEDFDMAKSMYSTTFKKVKEKDVIDNIKENKVVFEIDNNIATVKPSAFEEDNQDLISEKREELLKINGFSNCIEYINIYEKTKNIEIINTYYNLIESWINNYRYESKEVGLMYNDMCTAYRVYNWIRFYDVARNHLTEEQNTKLLTSIIYQATLLEEMQYNTRGTNHGLYQDVSNLFYLKAIKSNYIDDRQLEATIYNIEQYFEHCVSDNGVHLEHSPEYHIYMMNSVENLIDIFSAQKLDTSMLKEKLEKMEKYLIYITKPNNLLPEIGDTDVRKADISEYAEKYKDEKLPVDVVYKDEGYGIFRKSFEDDTYILFYNAYNSYYHKHSDENSLWIYRDGDIIREAGKNGYTYTETFTKYAYSSWGHNTLIVNGKGLVEEKNIPNDYNYAGTYIEDYEITDDSPWITGVNTRYAGVEHKRKVNYNKKKDIVYVYDTIAAEEENIYTLLWNLAPEITAKTVGENINLYRDNEHIMTIKFDTENKYSIKLIRGQTEPKILGWKTNLGNVTETTVIKIDFEKYKVVEITTQFVFEN